MQNEFQELDNNSLDRDAAISFTTSMFKVEEFLLKVRESFRGPGHNSLVNALAHRGGIPSDVRGWFNQGVDCEILKPDAKGWRKGKLRIRIALEFCPDEPEEVIGDDKLLNGKAESSLDDIRQIINE